MWRFPLYAGLLGFDLTTSVRCLDVPFHKPRDAGYCHYQCLPPPPPLPVLVPLPLPLPLRYCYAMQILPLLLLLQLILIMTLLLMPKTSRNGK